jgi:aminoglycoside phosphotransferase (APT) family kinase protein
LKTKGGSPLQYETLAGEHGGGFVFWRVFSGRGSRYIPDMTAFDTDHFRNIITTTFPELATSRFELATAGWDSVAVDVDDRLIFKFPRHAVAEKALLREAQLLAVIRPQISMPVPDLRIEQGPPLFSVHEKLKGVHLVTADYDRLPEVARQRLGERLGRFYAELHRLDQAEMMGAGAGPVGPWQPVAAMRERALPMLTADTQEKAAAAIDAFEQLPPDPYGSTYGFFDGHGWNMAFDHVNQQLSGMYDFADSGFAPVHQEFIYASFVSPNLTERIIASYEAVTGRTIDRWRVDILTAAHRLSELAELADNPEHVRIMIDSVESWARTANLQSLR